jgi:fatty acid desaturase 2 (delta-6 desaturase)
LQHDFGHLSVFKSNKMNHFVHRVIICFLKGVSADWWNYRHFIHHAKPNAIRKDLDMRFYPLFVLGKVIPREIGEKKKGTLPYNLQHLYFFMVIPPLLLPVYFNIENVIYLYKRKNIKVIIKRRSC